jgi:hypothetical protein
VSDFNAHCLDRYVGGELRAELLVPQGLAVISVNNQLVTVHVTLQNLKGMPNSIQLHPFVAFGQQMQSQSVQNPLPSLCSGSTPLGSAQIPASFPSYFQGPTCATATLTSTGLYAFTQTFSVPVSPEYLLFIRAFAAINVVTTAVVAPGELRGQLVQTFQDVFYTGPAPVIPQPMPPVPSTMVSTTVPLNFGQQNTPWTMQYTATPTATGSCIVTASGASFNLTITPSSNAITFSDIVITQLSSALTMVHIHGPCSSAACNAPVVYTICGPPLNKLCPLANANSALTIPGFTVDITQQTNDGSQLLGLYQSILDGASQYYVNFHTNA